MITNDHGLTPKLLLILSDGLTVSLITGLVLNTRFIADKGLYNRLQTLRNKQVYYSPLFYHFCTTSGQNVGKKFVFLCCLTI